MRFPLKYNGITKAYGVKGHSGIDFGWHSVHNAPVYAIADGVVDYVKRQVLGGNAIRIKHYKDKNGKYVYSEYGHLKDKGKVKVGQKVKMGQQIGNMGKSGVAKGEHLHLTMYIGKYSKKVNPLFYLCLYKDQEVSPGTAKNFNIHKTKKVTKCEELNIRNKPNTKGKVIRTAKKGSEVESFGVQTGWNVVDNLRDYYCSNKYLK